MTIQSRGSATHSFMLTGFGVAIHRTNMEAYCFRQASCCYASGTCAIFCIEKEEKTCEKCDKKMESAWFIHFIAQARIYLEIKSCCICSFKGICHKSTTSCWWHFLLNSLSLGIVCFCSTFQCCSFYTTCSWNTDNLHSVLSLKASHHVLPRPWRQRTGAATHRQLTLLGICYFLNKTFTHRQEREVLSWQDMPRFF